MRNHFSSRSLIRGLVELMASREEHSRGLALHAASGTFIVSEDAQREQHTVRLRYNSGTAPKEVVDSWEPAEGVPPCESAWWSIWIKEQVRCLRLRVRPNTFAPLRET